LAFSKDPRFGGWKISPKMKVFMSRVEELGCQIKALSARELGELRAWMAEFDADIWDGGYG